VTRVPGFFLEKVHFAEIRVVDGKGAPVAGARVSLIKPDGSKDPRTSDSNGIGPLGGALSGGCESGLR